jgi:hypothetical protein
MEVEQFELSFAHKRNTWVSIESWAMWRSESAVKHRVLKLAKDAGTWSNGDLRRAEEKKAQSLFLRDIFGPLPFFPPSPDPGWLSWHGSTIPKLARAIYDERALPSSHLDNTRLAILADALEDAGCTDPDLLGHCRSPGPHVRGCWVVDLLLGKDTD